MMQHPLVTVNYPPPPWHMLGQCWAGLFRADQPPALPAGLRPVLPRHVVLGLVRYREGTLRYDELFTTSLARRGLRTGLFVHDIWVDSAASQAGGRAIWGLPKQLATFIWHPDGVRVCDDDGVIAAITLRRALFALPPLPLRGTGIGQQHGQPLFFDIPLWACMGRAALRLDEWPARFSYRLAARPLLSVALNPFRATFLPPDALREGKGTGE